MLRLDQVEDGVCGAGPLPRLDVEVVSAAQFLSIENEWRDLVNRALVPNAFMEPAVVAAAESAGTVTRTLLVWQRYGAKHSRILVGAWALSICRATSWLPIEMLRSPLNRHTHLGTPVLDRLVAKAALAAMIDALRVDRSLPGLLHASDFEVGPVHDLLLEVLFAEGSPWRMMERRRRPKLESEMDGGTYLSRTLSRARRKRLSRARRQLEALGELSHSILSEPAAIRAGFETFLALEAAGWKAKWIARGQALLLRSSSAAFARRMISGLAKEGLVTLHCLSLNGRPIVIDVLISSGGEAYSWKTAYDESLRRYAPGLLLLDAYTRHLLDCPSVKRVDSCNRRDRGVMSEFWAERREVEDLLIGTPRGASAFALVSAVFWCRYQGKTIVRTCRDWLVRSNWCFVALAAAV